MRAHPLYVAALVATGVALAAQSGAGQRSDENLRPDTVPVHLLDPIVLEGRIDDLTTIATTASQGIVGNRDFRLRPLVREGELLETVRYSRRLSERTATRPLGAPLALWTVELDSELLSPAGRARGRHRERPFPSGRTATGPDYSFMGGLT